MADEDPDDASPWTRDDWLPDSAVPDDGALAGQPRSAVERPVGRPDAREPLPEDFDDPPPGANATSRSTTGRKVVAGAVVLALLVGSAGALLRSGDDPDETPDPTVVPESIVDTVVTTRPSDTSASTTVLAAVVATPKSGQSAAGADPILPFVVGLAEFPQRQ